MNTHQMTNSGIESLIAEHKPTQPKFLQKSLFNVSAGKE